MGNWKVKKKNAELRLNFMQSRICGMETLLNKKTAASVTHSNAQNDLCLQFFSETDLLQLCNNFSLPKNAFLLPFSHDYNLSLTFTK